MSIKKTFPSFILATTLLMTLVACGGETALTTNSPEENQPAELVSQSTEEDPALQEDLTLKPEPTPTKEPQPEQPSSVVSPISYAEDVQPIIESRCLNCHGGERIEGDFVVITYQDLLAGGESGPVIIPGDADGSYLAELLLDQKMPKRGPKLTPVQTQLIIDWIGQGAMEN